MGNVEVGGGAGDVRVGGRGERWWVSGADRVIGWDLDIDWIWTGRGCGWWVWDAIGVRVCGGGGYVVATKGSHHYRSS